MKKKRNTASFKGKERRNATAKITPLKKINLFSKTASNFFCDERGSILYQFFKKQTLSLFLKISIKITPVRC